MVPCGAMVVVGLAVIVAFLDSSSREYRISYINITTAEHT